MALKKSGRSPKKSVGGGSRAEQKMAGPTGDGGKGVSVEVATFRPGLVQSLRSGLDLTTASARPQVLRLAEHARALEFGRLEAIGLTLSVEAEGEGLFCVKLSGKLLVHPEVQDGKRSRVWTTQERKKLLAAVGEGCEAFVSLRAPGEATDLASGKDIFWVKQCAVRIGSANPAKER